MWHRQRARPPTTAVPRTQLRVGMGATVGAQLPLHLTPQLAMERQLTSRPQGKQTADRPMKTRRRQLPPVTALCRCMSLGCSLPSPSPGVPLHHRGMREHMDSTASRAPAHHADSCDHRNGTAGRRWLPSRWWVCT